MSGVVFRPAGVQQLHEAVAYGMLNYGYAIEADSKANAVVRGGHRSFAPNGPVGGNLRRSYHAVVYVDGVRLGSDSTDENGRPFPAYAPGSGIWLYVGTNAGYGFWVEAGTRVMDARPTLVPAMLKNRAAAPQLIAAGAQKHLAGR
jgi:hypothetical protein